MVWLLRRWLGPPVPEAVRGSKAYTSLSPYLRKRFLFWREKHRLPAIELKITGRPADSDRTGTRMGGQAWIPNDHEWPRDENGDRLDFFAQLDFDQLPRLQDFPDGGVLQFFVLKDPWEAVGTKTEDLHFRVFYHRNLAGAGRFESSDEPISKSFEGKLLLDDVLRNGLAFSGTLTSSAPSVRHQLFQKEIVPGLSDKEIDELWDFEDELHRHGSDLTGRSSYYIGGYPYLDQWFGSESSYDDRSLLVLWMYGKLGGEIDGTIHVDIPRDDLRALNFSRRSFYYDST